MFDIICPKKKRRAGDVTKIAPLLDCEKGKSEDRGEVFGETHEERRTLILFYYAGAENKKHYPRLEKMGVKNYLFSFYFLDEASALAIKPEHDVFLDSGGFSARKYGAPIDVYKYAEYIKANGHRFKVIANLDTASVEETLQNEKILKKETGREILPVYHFSDFRDNKELLQDYLRDHDYVAIGGVASVGLKQKQVKAYLDYVFHHSRGKKLHGFGMNGKRIVERYPFYSVDSSAWLMSEKFGSTKTSTHEKIVKYQNKHLHYTERTSREIKHYLDLEDYITRLWAKRGIIWDK